MCSDCILSDPELSVLKKGLNFVVTPRQVPVVDMITITETACRNLSKGDAKTYKRFKGDLTRKFKGEIVSILKDFRDESNNTRTILETISHCRPTTTVLWPPQGA